MKKHLLKFLLTFLIAISAGWVNGQTTLSAGDIAIIGANADAPDVFAFVLLVDIETGTEIRFTDSGWDNTSLFRASEGAVKYTAPSAVSAGTVISCDISDLGALPANFTRDDDAGIGTNGMNLSSSGDQVFAFQGLSTSPTFIYAMQFNSLSWQDTCNGTTNSVIPDGLVDGTSAVSFGTGTGAGDEYDNVSYDFATQLTSGTVAELLAAISDDSKWLGDNSNRYDFGTASFTVTADTEAPVATFDPEDASTNHNINDPIILTFNESIYASADGSAFDNTTIDGIVTLKETDAGGADVGFDAVIDGTEKIVTITPSAALTGGQVYYLAITGFEDALGNETTGQNITFTATDKTVAVTGPAAATEYYAGDVATVTWTSTGITTVDIDLWTPFTSTWESVATGVTAGDGTKDITIPAASHYSTAYKVRVVDADEATVNAEGAEFTVKAVASTIAALRTYEIAEIVNLTGEVVVTYLHTSRNQKMIQDATAAILIDDDGGIITTPYSVGDGITGIEGTLGEYGGMLQFVPEADPGAATAGYAITVQEPTMADFESNFEDYEGELVKFINDTAADNASSGRFDITDGTTTLTVDDIYYADAEVGINNGTTYTVTGFAYSYFTNLIAPRDAADIISHDATLSDLAVDNGTLVPAFDAATIDYTVELPYGTTAEPVVTATENNTNANAVITQATDVEGDLAARTATVIVTAEDGTTTETYTIVFSVALNDDATLSDLTVDNGTLVPVFDAATEDYTVELPYGTTVEPIVGATETDPNANAVITQATDVEGDLAARTATVVVTAEDGSTTKTYTVVFSIAAPATDATLDTLIVDNGTLVPVFDSATEDYTVELPYGTTVEPIVTATENDPNANAVITQATDVEGDLAARTATVVVTAEDGSTTKTYTVVFSITAPATDATLSALTTDMGTLVPAFDAATENYTVELPNGTTDEPTVGATENDPNANAVITQVSDIEGDLAARTATIVVTAEDGSTTKTYTIVFSVVGNDVKDITSFSFAALSVDGVITEADSTIAVTVPFGTDVTALVATFATTGQEVKVDATTQVSGTTPNDFTNPVIYTVIAADLSE
ncbi:beta strand repeat-containing protein, partial [Bacteroidota bacterium]